MEFLFFRLLAYVWNLNFTVESFADYIGGIISFETRISSAFFNSFAFLSIIMLYVATVLFITPKFVEKRKHNEQ